ncbi:MAG: S1C family serine protease [Clostridiales bacterium]|jgi:S1-C subfamily serine protease|nr:S1C family serine protease [Clostridiales bacterium]
MEDYMRYANKFKRMAVLLLTLAVAAAFCGCGFVISGAENDKALSAYEIAVENGFEGTEEEWLASLKGRDGKDAVELADIDIYDVYDAYEDRNPGATFEQFLLDYLSLTLPNPEPTTAAAVATAMRSAVLIRAAFGTGTQMGAGVIYSLDKSAGNAYIITNYHVIYNEDTAAVSSSIAAYLYGADTESTSARISCAYAGGSPKNDIAVLRVTGSAVLRGDYPAAATVADSDVVRVGSGAVAVGNPMGEGISVTSGVVSVDSETIQMADLNGLPGVTAIRVMRVDAAVNGGNSGGGIFNKSGELIGIVNAKLVYTGNKSDPTYIEDVAYAIPSNVAAGIAKSVINNDGKKIVTGVTVTGQNPAARYDSQSGASLIEETVRVSAVASSSPAENILQINDVIVSVTITGYPQKQITRAFMWDDYLYNAPQNAEITVNLLRSGLPLTRSFTCTALQPV